MTRRGCLPNILRITLAGLYALCRAARWLVPGAVVMQLTGRGGSDGAR